MTSPGIARVRSEAGARTRRRTALLRQVELRSILIASDILAAGLAAWGSPFILSVVDRNYRPTADLAVWQWAFVVVWFAALRMNGGGDLFRPRLGRRSLRAVFLTLAMVTGAVLVGFYFVPFVAPRSSSLLTLLLAGTLTLVMRFAYLRLVTWPLLDRRVAIVGTDEAAIRSAEAIQTTRGAVPYRVVAFVAPVGATPQVPGVPVLDPTHDLWESLRELDIDLIVVGHTQSLSPSVLTELVRCFEQGVEALPATVLYEQLTGRVMVSALEADWYAGLPTRVSGPYVALKRVVDVVVSAIGLLAIPLWIVVALAIVIDTGRPVLVRQVRIGQRGERFVIHKFRTMGKDAEEHGAPLWSTPDDPRCTRVGRVLRRLHLDEVPQLWDVLRGRMSLIGPRPERPEFVERIASALPLYHARALVKPGITGWAQVLFPYAGSVDQSLEKLEFDLYYVRHFGGLLDLSIALRTIALILGLAKPDYPEPAATTR